jgi:hypothetical protein
VVTRADGSVHQVQHLGGDITDAELVACTIQALQSLVYRPHAGELFAVEAAVQYSP